MDENRRTYETRYDPEVLRHPKQDRYDRSMSEIRLSYLKQLAPGRVTADLGCGSGAYLFAASALAHTAIGVDFSGTLVRAAQSEVLARGVSNIRLVMADLRSLPVRSDVVDLVYSFGTMYYVPDPERAIREAARITHPGGHVLLELGNRYSLNTLVAAGVTTGVRSHHIAVTAMSRYIASAGLDILEHRRFQLLPMYGGPRVLRPLVTSKWRWLMARSVGGQLIDETISSLPILRLLAFRHLILCRKR